MINERFDSKKISMLVVLAFSVLMFVLIPSVNAALTVAVEVNVTSTADGSSLGTATITTDGIVGITTAGTITAGSTAAAGGYDLGQVITISDFVLDSTEDSVNVTLSYPIDNAYEVATASMVQGGVPCASDGAGNFTVALTKQPDNSYATTATLNLVDKVIDEITVTGATLTLTDGIAEPSVFTAAYDSSKYIITEGWREVGTGDYFTTFDGNLYRFSWNKTYEYFVTFTMIDDNYTFSATPSLSLNGTTYTFDAARDSVTDTEVTFGANSALFTAVSPDVVEIDTIKLGSVLLNAVGGNAPELTAVSLETDKYVVTLQRIYSNVNSRLITNSELYNNDFVEAGGTLLDKFISGDYYNYELQIEAKDGYKFADDVDIIVNSGELNATDAPYYEDKKSIDFYIYLGMAEFGETNTVIDGIPTHVYTQDEDGYWEMETLENKASIESLEEDVSVVGTRCIDIDFDEFIDDEEEVIEGYDVGAYIYTYYAIGLYTSKDSVMIRIKLPIPEGYSNSDPAIVIGDNTYLPISYVSGYAIFDLPVEGVYEDAEDAEAYTKAFMLDGKIYFRYGDNTQSDINPATGDNIFFYVILLVVATTGFAGVLMGKINLNRE